jgi:hypothetical protein
MFLTRYTAIKFPKTTKKTSLPPLFSSPSRILPIQRSALRQQQLQIRKPHALHHTKSSPLLFSRLNPTTLELFHDHLSNLPATRRRNPPCDLPARLSPCRCRGSAPLVGLQNEVPLQDLEARMTLGGVRRRVILPPALRSSTSLLRRVAQLLRRRLRPRRKPQLGLRRRIGPSRRRRIFHLQQLRLEDP